MEANDPSAMRISDSDRHKVSELLREAAGEGRLEVEELEERLEATFAAKTYADLVPITADLPTKPGGLPMTRSPQGVQRRGSHDPRVPGPTHASSFAVMSETKRKGAWTVPAEHAALAVMGSVVLDLRDADFSEHETVINANAVMGSVEIFVDAWTVVSVEGFGVMGAYQEGRSSVPAELEPGSPVVRVKGFALMGSVEVKRKGDPTKRRKLLGR